MIYLASPYSHKDPLVVRTRFLLTMQATAALIKQGHFVWSPIVHCHEMAERHTMPTDAEFWKSYNFDFIRRADAIFLLAISGWDQSKGVAMELDLARDLNIPVKAVNEMGDFLDGKDFQYGIADAINGVNPGSQRLDIQRP